MKNKLLIMYEGITVDMQYMLDLATDHQHPGVAIAEQCTGKQYDYVTHDHNELVDDTTDVILLVEFALSLDVTLPQLSLAGNVIICSYFEPLCVSVFNYISYHRIKKSNLWYISANATIFDHPLRPTDLKVGFWDFFSKWFVKGMNFYSTTNNTKDVEQRDFLCLNMKIRPNRLELLKHLSANGLEKTGYISFGPNNTIDGNSHKPNLFCTDQYRIPCFDDITPWTDRVYYEIVTDHAGTPHHLHQRDNNFVFLSEKIYRAIHNKNPFVLYAMPKTLHCLRALGYKTYSDLLDESYDDEYDWKQRGEMIAKIVKDFSQKTLEEKQQWHERAQDIAEYNYNHLQHTQGKLYLAQFYEDI